MASTVAVGGNIVADESLVLYLDASNPESYPGSGTSWYDLTPYRNHGILTNGPTFSNDAGGSISFDGNNDSVQCSDSDSLSITTDITLSIWAKFTNLNNYRGLISKGSSFYPQPYDFYVNPNNQAFYGSLSSPAAIVGWQFAYQGTGPNSPLSDNIWYNIVVAIQYNVPSNLVTYNFYINGLSVGSPTTTYPTGIIDGNGPLYIGNRADGFTPMLGNIAIAQIYNRAISAQEVLQNYNALKSRFGYF